MVLKALYPKKDPIPLAANIQGSVDKTLRNIAADFKRAMSTYPPQQRPANGRKPYRRTGDYGRFWNAPNATTNTPGSVTIINRVSRKGRPYGIWVGGPVDQRPGQARFMGSKGWLSVTKATADIRIKYPHIMAQALRGENL